MPIEIDLWIWSLDTDEPTSGLLTPQERRRAGSYVRAEDASRFRAGRARLRRILSDYTGIAPPNLALATTGRGKPVLPGGPAFNLSHAGGLAVLAVAPRHGETEAPLGIDIEPQRSVDPGVADISLSDAERAELSAYSGADWTAAFFRCWTGKEAVIKALGHGLHIELGSFDISRAAGKPPVLTRIGADFPQPDLWRMADLDLSPSLPGALACITGGRRLQVSLREAPESVRPLFRF